MLRYYWISTLIVLGLTTIIAIATQKKSVREVVVLFVKVTLGAVIFGGTIYGISHLLTILRIAEEGFVF